MTEIKKLEDAISTCIYCVAHKDTSIAHPFKVYGFEKKMLAIFIYDDDYIVTEFPSQESYKRYVEARFNLFFEYKRKAETLA